MAIRERKMQAADSQKMVVGAVPTVPMKVKPKRAGPMMAELEGRKDLLATLWDGGGVETTHLKEETTLNAPNSLPVSTSSSFPTSPRTIAFPAFTFLFRLT